MMVSCGCFEGDIDAFEAAEKKTYNCNEHGVAYRALITFVKSALWVRRGEQGGDAIMTCGECDAHMTGNKMREIDRQRYWSVNIWPYDHYCIASKSGRRKIKSASDFSGQERPTWCPRREMSE